MNPGPLKDDCDAPSDLSNLSIWQEKPDDAGGGEQCLEGRFCIGLDYKISCVDIRIYYIRLNNIR